MCKQYDREFKLVICQNIEDGQESVSSVSKEYAISRPIVSRWLSEYRRYKKGAFAGHGKRLPDKAEVFILQKQIEELKMENELLKKFEHLVKRKKQ